MADLYKLLESLSGVIIVLTFIQCVLSPGSDPIKFGSSKKLRNPSNASIFIEVYYDGLDGPSHEFITEQLIPTYEKLEKFADIYLVPFGRTDLNKNANNTYEFRCVPDALQCEANLQHACIGEYIKQTPKMLAIIECLMKNYKDKTPSEGLEMCAQQKSIDKMENITQCIKGVKGTELLKKNQEMTAEASKGLYDDPFIIVYGDKLNETKLQQNLFDNICKLGDATAKWKSAC